MDRSTRTASIPEKDIRSSSPPNPAVRSRRVLRSNSREGELASLAWGVFTCLCSIVSWVAGGGKAARPTNRRTLAPDRVIDLRKEERKTNARFYGHQLVRRRRIASSDGRRGQLRRGHRCHPQ